LSERLGRGERARLLRLSASLSKDTASAVGEMAEPSAPPAANANFDLEAYLSNYAGVTRVKRLAFISSVSPSLKKDALAMAAAEVKRTSNTGLYLELVTLSGEDGGLGRDDAWVEQVDRKAQQRLDKLESELNNHKTSLVKESIRMGHTDLGDFHYERGDFNAALKCFVRTRDYCTTSKHIVAMCLNVIKASIQMGNFTHVANYITKAESTPDGTDATLAAQLRVAAGLAFLESKKYKLAARKFLEVSPELGSQFSEVASAQDIALYGGLCALASFDRAELRAKLVESANFKTYLELYPQVREAVHDFFHSRYASCLDYLDKLKPDLLLDLHLHDHVKQLYDDVRSKALVQYFSPFVSVDMKLMATAFNVSVEALEKELAALIMAQQIPARIDSQAKVLYARHADQRTATFATALKMGEEYMRDTRALLLRINLMRADFIVKGEGQGIGPSKSSRQEGRAAPFSGMDSIMGMEGP